MTHLVVVAALLAPATCWAQTQLPLRVVKTPQRPTIPPLLNPHFLNLGPGAFLYRHLQDTLSNRYATSLAPGNWELDLVQFVNAHWVAVRWRPHSAPYAAGDTAVFYLSRATKPQIVIQL
jgi:hypothetical protein